MPRDAQQGQRISHRVRCKDCGSTRMRGIVLGYLDGRITTDAEGRMIVDSGSFETHSEYDIEQGSVICENCGGFRPRVERRVVRA